MKSKQIVKIAMNTGKLVLPLAALSVTLLWYFWIMEGLIRDLMNHKTRTEMVNPKRGIARSCPVPASFLTGTSMFPCKCDDKE